MPNRLPSTRHSLILRLADAGDGKAWEEFIDVYERAIVRYAMSRGLQPADAEDVTQQVLEAVLAKATRWDPQSGGSFGAWIFRVTRNLAAKRWNEQRKMPTQLSDSGRDLLDRIPDAAYEEKQAFRTNCRTALFHWAAERVRRKVSDESWSAFWMSAVEQEDAERVARKLGVTKSTVYVAKCRVLKRMRSEVERFEEDFSSHTEID